MVPKLPNHFFANVWFVCSSTYCIQAHVVSSASPEVTHKFVHNKQMYRGVERWLSCIVRHSSEDRVCWKGESGSQCCQRLWNFRNANFSLKLWIFIAKYKFSRWRSWYSMYSSFFNDESDDSNRKFLDVSSCLHFYQKTPLAFEFYEMEKSPVPLNA